VTLWATLIVIMIITTGVLVKGLRDSPRASLERLYDEKMVAASVARDNGDTATYHKCSNDAKEILTMIRRLNKSDSENQETHRHLR